MYTPPGRFERAIDKAMVYVVAPLVIAFSVLAFALGMAL